MPQTPITPHAPVRHVDELLLAASDVAVVDRATLSLWHFQHLLRPHLAPAAAAPASHDKPTDAGDDKENNGVAAGNQETAAAATAATTATMLPTSVELDEGMTVAAVAFADSAGTEDADNGVNHEGVGAMELTSATVDAHVAAGVGGRVLRTRRASITESEMSVDDEPDAATSIPNARLSMATRVSVIYRRYRCVLCLDASPSALSIDVHSGKVFLDMLFESVELFVRNLLQPIEVGGVAFVPEFHVSVMVHGAYVESLCVLVQGFVLDLLNADRLLQLVRERLTLMEDEWAATARAVVSGTPGHRASLSSMLQNAVFALNSLPSGSAPLIVLATDGVVDLLNAYTYDSLVMQLVRHDIQCHFLRVGGAPWNGPHASFGYVPDVDLLEFVAQASGGSVTEYVSLYQTSTVPPVRDSVKCMSTFQTSLLVRPSKVQAISAPVLKLDMTWCASYDGSQYMPLRPYRMWREKVHEYRIQTDVQHIVEARIREGFAVNKVHVRMMQRAADGSLVKMPVPSVGSAVPAETPASPHAATKVLLVFVLQWKQNVWLEYVISSTIDNQPHGRASVLSRSGTSKTVGGTGSTTTASSGHLKKDPTSAEWYVKVNVLADGEFLRSFEDSRSNAQARQANVGAAGAPISLHEFIRHVQDVDRVLLHLMTAAASVISATDTASHFSFGSHVNHSVSTAPHLHHTTNKSQASHPVFGIIGELSPVLWHRWFHVDRFEVLAVVVDDPSPQTFYPRGVQPQVIPRTSSLHPTSRARQSRRAGMSLEANVHPLLVGRDFTVDRIRGALLRWSSHRLGKDLFLRFLSSDSQRTDDRNKQATPVPAGGVPVGKRRQQRSSLNSATLAAQINASMEQTQLQHKREEPSKGALCFVRVEAKNHTLVVIHVAFFSASVSTRRETLAELKNIVAANDSAHNAAQGSVGGVSMTPNAPGTSRKLVLCHRMLSRLLVTHDTLVLEDTDNHPDSPLDSDVPMVACCGGSELQLRSVFGAFMWHSSWKWRLSRNSNTSLMEVMRHLHEARIRAGFWVLDWNVEEDGDSMRTASVIFGREILMEDENGHLKTSLIQYGISRTADNCLLTSFWMEPQYGFAKTTLARDATITGQHDTFHRSLRHAVGHEVPLSELVGRSAPSAFVQNGYAERKVGETHGSASPYLDEGKLLALIREFIFDSDRHLLSCLHTFETVASVQEAGIDALTQRYASQPVPGIVGMPAEVEEQSGCRALVPAFSTARLLESSKRSSEHFLMYLERGVDISPEVGVIDSVPALSPANIYLYSMLERTLRSLSDCEVAWTDGNGGVIGDALEHPPASCVPTISSQLPLWFLQRQFSSDVSNHRHLSHGCCFAKLLPNETVILAFLPAISTLTKRKRPMLSPTDAAEKSLSGENPGVARWHQRHQLKATTSMETGQLVAAQSSMLKMSVSADDIVLYQERRQSFREGYKSWRMGHFQGAKDDKSHRAGHSGQLSPHPKVTSFSEDYEFCESVCREAEVGSDFHLLIEKADGELGSGYFQVAFYECSLAQLSATLTAEPFHGQTSSHEQLLSQLFTRRVSDRPTNEPAVENNRIPPINKRGTSTTFGSRAGSGIPPPSPLSIPVEPAREESEINLAVFHSSMTFRKKVKRAHEHNFSRGVYVSLRDGAPVQQSDLIQALSSCVEVPMDLDITLLYRMLQVDMIRETVPRSALRSSMIDMLSGKPIRDALKERLDKSLEGILSTLFHGIADTKYFVFVGSENVAVDDVVGVADNEGDAVQLMVEEDGMADSDNMPMKPPRLVKSITIATDTTGFGHSGGQERETLERSFEEAAVNELVGSTFDVLPATAGTASSVGEDALAASEDQHQHQINQEEDAELNKDVAAATSSFSSPFFFRFECRELLKEPPSRPRSTSSGVNNLELPSPASKSVLQRSASSKSFLDPMGTTLGQPSSAVLPLWQRNNGSMDGTETVTKSATGGISEIAEWAATMSGPKIALRLVTLTLPNEQLLERTRGHQIGVDVDDKRQKVPPAELFSSLPFFQRQVLKRMRKSIKEWSSTEILGILRNVECITPAIAHLVQKLFRDLPEACRTTVKYPLSFVNVHHESVDPVALLEKELRIGTDSLHLVECGGLYFVVSRLSDVSFKVPYWAFLSIEDGNIILHLHHQPIGHALETYDGFDRLEVLTSLHLAVNAVCKRVNQFLLLLQLHETRSCNELLIPADPGTSSAGPPSPTSAVNRNHGSSSSGSSTFFWPGQFECDRKYAAFFRLNERMVPSIALTTLCTQALEQFQVHNRRHVFVYRDRGGHVFYMKMSVATSDAVNQPTKPYLLRANSNGSPSGGTPSGILLEVFGVCCAGEEVTQELCKLLERKLDETMQLILMKLLARNTKFQLSSSDMAFMCPPGVRPAKSTVYKVPSGLVPRSDASTALLFLCQTLGMTSYMRQINTSSHAQVTGPSRYERQSSTRSTTSSRVAGESAMSTEVIQGANSPAPNDVTDESVNATDSSVLHPAMFGQQGTLAANVFDGTLRESATTSPVFFLDDPSLVKTPKTPEGTAPVTLGDATFAVNLNSELRLSPGFLSRVGKGLAVLKVEVLQCDGDNANAITKDGSEIAPLEVGQAFASSSDLSEDGRSSILYVRCQLWVRGPIQVEAFRSVYESHVRESLCDYAIEAIIRNMRRRPKAADAEEDTVEHTAKMSPEVTHLVDLLETSARMSSSSVTKFSLPVAVQSWDVGCIATQVHKYLGGSLPVQARPAVFGPKGSQFVRIDPNELRAHEGSQVKLIPIPPIVESGAAVSSVSGGLASSESIHSELSELDSVSSLRHSVGSSTIESLSSASLLGSSSSLGLSKEFTTSELMFHSMAKGTGPEMAKNASLPVVQQRSFYYVIEVSVTGGLLFHGYNLSQQVVDAIALHLARVMTWSFLRDRMLQSLLLQRGGVGYAAPSGASIVHPRLLLSNGGSLNSADFAVNYVTFQATIVPILQAFDVIPKSVDTTGRLDISPFGNLLKDMGVQVIEKGELQRGRSRNPASSRPGADESSSRSGSMRSGILSSGNSQRSMGGAVEKPTTPKPSVGATVPSPTKRGSAGGLTPAISIGPRGNHQAGGPSAGNVARMRSNPTAANALMAARARARGGGFPGKMGGGPGVGSSRAAGEVAPWDLPVTNTKAASSTATSNAGPGKPLSQAESVPRPVSQTPSLGRSGSNGGGNHSSMATQKRPSGSKAALVPMASAARSASERKDSSANEWRSMLAQAWGPHYKYCSRNAFVQTTMASERSKNKDIDDPVKTKLSDPLRFYGAVFQRQQQLMVSCSTASYNCLGLFRRIQETNGDTSAIDVTDEKAVHTMMQSGHVMFHQRFRVSYIERWEVVKIDDEYVEDGSNTGRLRALQASMDLVNLLSYKQEFVFTGNERVVAKLLTEHTVQAMCGKEGQAVREMKLQILKAVFHSRMDVVQRFFDQYAAHLRGLGFHHLKMPSSRMGQKQSSTTSLIAPNTSSTSGSGSVTPTRSSVDAFASEGEAFSEFFVHSGGSVKKCAGGRRSTNGSVGMSSEVLVLELKCDYTGVQVSVVLVNEQDLRQQQLGHQRHLDPVKKINTQGALVKQVSQSLRSTLNTRMLIHDFTIRFFHRCLLDWTWRKPDGSSARPSTSSSTLHNMVKGVRCFLRSYPYSVSDKSASNGVRECALEAATVELPVRNLQSDFSESILVKILLRYIACHGSRYDVTDLTQFGTPDTIACHSAAGNFFSRQVGINGASSSSSSWSRPGSMASPGYSLLITTQELWKGKKRPKNSVLLALVQSAPPSAILLPTDRAMREAELFVKELFRAAAANYERDLLWSRLLHNDNQGPSADVAHALSLPVEHFRVEVGPQQLEECLRLSVCIPLQQIDPDLCELLEIDDVCWQEFALRLRDVYAGQVREYQFEGQAACHFLLLCPDARDLMIHLTFPSGITNATLEGDANRVHIDICRREEPANHKFSLPQRRAITDFVNNVVHWLWRCLLYD